MHVVWCYLVQNGGARVIANDPVLGMIVASKKSSNQVFPGYGLAKVRANGR